MDVVDTTAESLWSLEVEVVDTSAVEAEAEAAVVEETLVGVGVVVGFLEAVAAVEAVVVTVSLLLSLVFWVFL